MKFLKRHLSYKLLISVQNLEIRFISSVKIFMRSSASKYVARTTSWLVSLRRRDGRALSHAVPVSRAARFASRFDLSHYQATMPRVSHSPVHDLVYHARS